MFQQKAIQVTRRRMRLDWDHSKDEMFVLHMRIYMVGVP
jgi:hypothetical protein